MRKRRKLHFKTFKRKNIKKNIYIYYKIIVKLFKEESN